jgi:hypothetical protein
MRMAGRLSAALFLILAAAPAAADTYKWLDANGVVNYSNAPPPETAASAKRIGDRVSVVAADPSLGAAVAAMNARAAQRAQYDEADWQMRQRYLLAARASMPPYSGNAYGAGYDSYATPYYPVAYAPVFVTRAVRRFSPSPFFRHR